MREKYLQLLREMTRKWKFHISLVLMISLISYYLNNLIVQKRYEYELNIVTNSTALGGITAALNIPSFLGGGGERLSSKQSIRHFALSEDVINTALLDTIDGSLAAYRILGLDSACSTVNDSVLREAFMKVKGSISANTIEDVPMVKLLFHHTDSLVAIRFTEIWAKETKNAIDKITSSQSLNSINDVKNKMDLYYDEFIESLKLLSNYKDQNKWVDLSSNKQQEIVANISVEVNKVAFAEYFKAYQLSLSEMTNKLNEIQIEQKVFRVPKRLGKGNFKAVVFSVLFYAFLVFLKAIKKVWK